MFLCYVPKSSIRISVRPRGQARRGRWRRRTTRNTTTSRGCLLGAVAGQNVVFLGNARQLCKCRQTRQLFQVGNHNKSHCRWRAFSVFVLFSFPPLGCLIYEAETSLREGAGFGEGAPPPRRRGHSNYGVADQIPDLSAVHSVISRRAGGAYPSQGRGGQSDSESSSGRDYETLADKVRERHKDNSTTPPF